MKKTDCIAIVKDKTIPGHEPLPKHKLSVSFKVVLSNEAEMTYQLIDCLVDGIQEILLPWLIGCPDKANQKRNDVRWDTTSDFRRNLRL